MRALSGHAASPVTRCLHGARASSGRAPTTLKAPKQLAEREHGRAEQCAWAPEPHSLWMPASPEVQQALSPPLRHLGRPPPPAGASWQAATRLEALLERTSFQVQLDEPPQQRDKEKRADYYANVGDAIRTLRDDIPLLFAKELNCDIYREDILFTQSTLRFRGLENYKLIFWSLRFHGRLFFKRLSVDVVRIWQPDDSVIKMRWKVHGVPRVWWEAEGTFDGISTYKLDKDGRVYEHSVDNVQLRDPPITNPILYGLNYILRPRLAPHHMPVPGS